MRKSGYFMLMPSLALALPLASGTVRAFAQNPAGAETGRFQLEKAGEDYIRMDRQTGAMSVCSLRDGTLACRMAAEERLAYDEELGRLEKRIEALEAAARPVTRAPLPDDAEVERSISIMERFMRAFMGLAEELHDKDHDGKRDGNKANPT